MANPKRGLGRSLNDLGLDELLSSANTSSSPAPINTQGELKQIAIDLIQPGQYQPRKDFDPESLRELADSIAKQGIIQPIVLRKLTSENYEIIAGERRWRAAQMAGLSEVPAIIKSVSDDVAIALSLIENIQRENLNAIEEASALERLLNEFGMSHQQVAESVGKSRSTVTNLLRLLTLEYDVKTMVERGDLDMGHARALLMLEGPGQVQAAKTIVSKGLSVREAERLTKKMTQDNNKSTPTRNRPRDPSVLSLEAQLSDQLGANVAIHHQSSGKGRVEIHYNSLDELDGILEHIK